jgi:hypothetical protein
MLKLAHDDPFTDRYERPELPAGCAARWGHEPAHHGGEYVYPGRAVLVLPGHEWPDSPERCTNADPLANDWHFDGRILTCRRCGLDVT